MDEKIHCPKCGSTQITANKKGFSGKKAVVGAVLTGGVGLLAGTIGSNKVMITCLNCGKQFRPGDGKNNFGKTAQQQKNIDTHEEYIQNKQILENRLKTNPIAFKRAKTNLTILGVLFILLAGIFFASELNGMCYLFLFFDVLIWVRYSKVKALKTAFETNK